MTSSDEPPAPKLDAKALRAERVAAALRENLRRRKEQARARAVEDAAREAADEGKIGEGRKDFFSEEKKQKTFIR